MKMSISNINHLTPINQTYNYTGNTNLGNNVDNAKEKTQGDILQESINGLQILILQLSRLFFIYIVMC